MEPSKNAYHMPAKGANMCLNRFCIDEDDAFELSGVHYLKKCQYFVAFKLSGDRYLKKCQYPIDNSKGKGYSRLTLNDILV